MKTTLRFLLLIGASVFIWWSLTINSNKNGTPTPESNQPYIKIFMNDFKVTSLDSTGEAQYTLTGAHLEQYNNSNNAIITLPVFNFLPVDKQWLITADKASINQKNNIIKLTENVVMQQQNTPRAIKVTSNIMFINTNKQTAYTKTPVTIKQGLSEMNAIGMTYFNLESKLVLKSNVKGYYFNEHSAK